MKWWFGGIFGFEMSNFLLWNCGLAVDVGSNAIERQMM